MKRRYLKTEYSFVIYAALVAVVFVFMATPDSSVQAQIYNYQTNQVIPGTEAIAPGHGINLSGWNSSGHELEFAGLSSLDLTGASFADSDLTRLLLIL